jgi:excisionase family DNA binding protein
MTERMARLLTVAQAAELCNCAERTIRRALDRGEIEARWVGRVGSPRGLRVPEDVLDAWTRRGSQGPEDEGEGEAEAVQEPEPAPARVAQRQPRRRVLSRGVG